MKTSYKDIILICSSLQLRPISTLEQSTTGSGLQPKQVTQWKLVNRLQIVQCLWITQNVHKKLTSGTKSCATASPARFRSRVSSFSVLLKRLNAIWLQNARIESSSFSSLCNIISERQSWCKSLNPPFFGLVRAQSLRKASGKRLWAVFTTPKKCNP